MFILILTVSYDPLLYEPEKSGTYHKSLCTQKKTTKNGTYAHKRICLFETAVEHYSSSGQDFFFFFAFKAIPYGGLENSPFLEYYLVLIVVDGAYF